MKNNKPILFLTGQSGLLGTQLTQFLQPHYEVHGLQRTSQDANNPSWNYRPLLQQLGIKAPDAVIHLAGAGIADKRWSESYKKTIFDSRVNGTQWLGDEILTQEKLPKTLLCASAIGYYGHRPNEILDEQSQPGENFVANISQHWEQATNKIEQAGVRVAHLRFGMILSDQGGALKDMLLPYKLGLGGRLGDGQQRYSWIDIDDACRAILFLLQHATAKGPHNLTAPQHVSNQEFTRTLARTLNRPAFMHMPSFMVRLIFGAVADELLLADAAVEPKNLTAAGFEFKYPQLKQSLSKILS